MPLRKLDEQNDDCKTNELVYSPYLKDFVCLSGIPTLDYYIGGGFKKHSLCLLEDSYDPSYISLNFFKSFIRAGKDSGDTIIIVGKCPELFQQLDGEENAQNKEASSSVKVSETSENLKIAWRYQMFPKLSDDAPQIMKKPFSESTLPGHVICINSSLLSTMELLEALTQRMNPEKHNRILFWDFGSYNFVNSGNLLWFVNNVRAKLQQFNCVSLLGISRNSVNERELIPKLRHLSNYHHSVVSFDQHPDVDLGPNSLFQKDHVGMLVVEKTPYVNGIVPHYMDDDKFALKKRRQHLLLERLHLPPDLSDTANRSEVPISLPSCASSNSSKVSW